MKRKWKTFLQKPKLLRLWIVSDLCHTVCLCVCVCVIYGNSNQAMNQPQWSQHHWATCTYTWANKINAHYCHIIHNTLHTIRMQNCHISTKYRKKSQKKVLTFFLSEIIKENSQKYKMRSFTLNSAINRLYS